MISIDRLGNAEFPFKNGWVEVDLRPMYVACGMHVRLDDALTPAGARLQGPPGRVRRHDPRQHERTHPQKAGSLNDVTILKRALSLGVPAIQSRRVSVIIRLP